MRRKSTTARGPQGLPTANKNKLVGVHGTAGPKAPVSKKTVTTNVAIHHHYAAPPPDEKLWKGPDPGGVSHHTRLSPTQQKVAHRRAVVHSAKLRAALHDLANPRTVYAQSGIAGAGITTRGASSHFAAIGARPIKVKGPLERPLKGLFRDAIDFVPGTVSSTYHLADTTLKHGPVVAGKELAKGAFETLKHPQDHPLYAGMIFRGALKGADNTAGRVMRTVPGPTRKIASRARESRPIEGTGRAVPSQYAKGPVVKGAQVVRERHRVKHGKTAQKPVSPKEVKQLATEDVRAEETLTRHNQGVTAKKARDAIAPRKKLRRQKPTAAANLAAQGITDASRADIEAYLREIRSRHDGLPVDKQKRNEATQRLIEKALKSHDPVEVHRAATAASEVLHDLSRQVAGEGILTAREAETSSLAGVAARRHGASEETLRTARSAAKGTKKVLRSATGKARRDVQGATVELERAKGAAKVSVATRKQSPALKEAVRVRDQAVRRLAVLQRQLTAKSARNRALRKHSTNRAAAMSEAKRGDIAEQVRTARQAVRDAEARVAAETERIRGVGPNEADRLRRALARREDAVAARGSALQDEKAARAERVKLGTAGYVSDTGRPLLNEDIRASMPKDAINPAYVSHQDTPVRSAALPVDRPGVPHREHRTGDNVYTGTIDAHPAKLVEQARDSQRLIDSARARKRFIDGWAYRNKGEAPQTFSSQKVANDWAASQDLKGKTGHDWEAISRQDGRAVLIPKDAVGRLRDHLAEASRSRNNAFSVFSNQWRRNVLMWNPRWYVGNTFEAALRSLVAGAGPASYYTAQKVRGKLSPEDRLMLDARTRSGGHYESASQIISDRTIQRNAEDLKNFALALDKFRKAPGVHHAVDFYNGMTRIAFESLNGRIESQFQTAMLGRALRDHPLMESSTLKLSNKAFEEAARGLRNTDTMAELGRKVDDMYGQYGKFSPKMQNLIANYTPFIAWTLNAANFLYRVLPRDHPVLTGVIASANSATEKWRKEHRQFLDFWGQVDGQDPPWLQGAIPGKNGSHLRVGRYTPFGLLSQDGGTPFSGFASLLLPQVAEIGSNLQGKDWMGSDLSKHPAGSRAMLATGAGFIESMIPAAAQIDAITGTKLPNQRDTNKPQLSLGTRIRKTVDPLMYTRSGLPASKKVVKKNGVAWGNSGGGVTWSDQSSGVTWGG